MTKFAPKAHLTAATNSWGGYYIDTTKAVLAGTWKSNEVHGGLKEGMVKMSPLNAVVTPDAAKAFEAKKAALTAGTFNPFMGPIKDQSGAVKYPAATAVPAKDLASMNFYVQGVEGAIPK
jgi:basic membrane protein A